MRKLQTSDVFSCMRVISAAGLKEEFKEFADVVSSGKTNVRELGMEFIFTIIESCSSESVEKKFYQFCAGPFEMDPEEISKLDPMELIDKFKELSTLMDSEKWQAFFKSVSGMMR